MSATVQSAPADSAMERLRAGGRSLAALPVRARLAIVRGFRQRLAREPEPYIAALAAGPGRRPLEALAAELLPLADACRELERSAARLLRPRRAGAFGRPLWLGRLSHEVLREPHGLVAIVAPGNIPLLPAAVQTLQAFVAGNAVTLKPAPAGAAVLRRFVDDLLAAGLPAAAIELADPDPAAFQDRLAEADHVVVTGSTETGAAVLAQRGRRAPETTLELSGHDPVFVLPGAELDRVARALAFGLTWFTGEVCIAPRRVFVIGQDSVEPLIPRLRERVIERLADPGETPTDDEPEGAGEVPAEVEAWLARELAAGGRWTALAPTSGAESRCAGPGVLTLTADSPLLSTPAPRPGVLGLRAVPDVETALREAGRCGLELGAAVFGPTRAARALASRIRAGSVTINDVIAPTADPRAPFPARGASGAGATRGPEGLLAMTRLKVIHTRHGGPVPHLAAARRRDAAILRAWLTISRGGWRDAIAGLPALARALMMSDHRDAAGDATDDAHHEEARRPAEKRDAARETA